MISNRPNYTIHPSAKIGKDSSPLARITNNVKVWSTIRKTALKQDVSHPIQPQTIQQIYPSSPHITTRPPTLMSLTQSTRHQRLWTLPDERMRRSDELSTIINEMQFIKDSALVQYYSNHVFSQSFKFKRFTGILKKKFMPNPHTPEAQTPTQKRQQPATILIKSSNLDSPEWRCSKSKDRERECIDTLEPKLRLKRRPSSGIPMKKGEMVIKRRINSLNKCPRSCSMGIKHIDALKCSQRTCSPRAKPKAPIITKKPAVPQCIFLRPMQLRGKQQGIDPWEADAEKMRMLTDLDITIKL